MADLRLQQARVSVCFRAILLQGAELDVAQAHKTDKLELALSYDVKNDRRQKEWVGSQN